jgi:hypothetical protein
MSYQHIMLIHSQWRPTAIHLLILALHKLGHASFMRWLALCSLVEEKGPRRWMANWGVFSLYTTHKSIVC